MSTRFGASVSHSANSIVMGTLLGLQILLDIQNL